MLKVILTHYIWDMGLNIFFDNVKKNFSIAKQKIVPKIGDYFKRISNLYTSECFHDCIVVEVEERKIATETYYLVHVSYASYSGDHNVDTANYEDEMPDDDSDIIDDEKLNEMFDNGDVECIDMDGIIILNSQFYKFEA